MLTGSLTSQDFAQPALDEVYKAPESRLLLAVLQDALATFQRGLNTSVGKDRQMFREVDYWFRSRSDDSPFSFESICSTFRIDSACVRDLLNRLKRSALLDDETGGVQVQRIPREGLYTRRAWVNRIG
jgi:hypothetical protein